MRRASDLQAVESLSQTGRSDYEVSRLTGVPRTTVQRWRTLGGGQRRRLNVDRPWRPPDGPAYCHLLGLYLGDGCITRTSTSSSVIAITLDKRYPGIVAQALSTLRTTFPETPVHCYGHKRGCFLVQMSHPRLPAAFPQHGPGRKHLRRIALTDWQLDLTRRAPETLLGGLIHSDGARCVNRFDTELPNGRVAHYEYPRYFFSNLSSDIRGIFCDHCDLLGIRWTQSNHRNISVSHRDSVALLDSFLGPKE